MMLRIVLGVWIVLLLLRVTDLLSQTGYNQERYVRLSEKHFDTQNFDSCLYYHYILAHYYANSHDSASLADTWFDIAIINLLQEKYVQAKAAQSIACRYIPYKTSVYNDLKIVYYNILKVKCQTSHQPLPLNTLNLAGLSSPPLRKLYYIPQLSEAEYKYRNNQSRYVKTTLLKLLNKLKEQGDTNWFGYAKANLLMGDCFYTSDDYIQSVPYYETAIHFYNVNQIYNTDCITAYRRFLYALRAIGQNEKRDSVFQSIEKGNLINRNRAAYYFIKGDFVRYASFQEALDDYLQGYYSADVDAENKKKLERQIIFVYAKIGQYDKAKSWLKRLDTSNMDDYEKVLIAYSCFKVGDIARGKALIRELENKKKRYNEDILYWLAKYYFEAKKYDKAEMYFNQYMHYLLKTYNNSHYNNMNSFSDLSYFYWYGRANYRRSLEYYHKAVFELVNEHAPDDLYQMPDISKSISDNDLARELNNKGEALFEVSKLNTTKAETLRDLKASLANLELSFTVAHRYKMSLTHDEQRFLYADGIQHRYPYIINVCIKLFQETGNEIYANKAFEYAEKSKASLLLSTMRGVNAHNLRLLPDNLKQTEEQIWTKTELISKYLSESYKAPDINRTKIDQYNVILNQLKHRQDSLISIFKYKYPAYYNARYNAEIVDADSLQRLLKPSEAVLEYSVSSDKLIIYLLTRNDFKIFADTLGSQFFADVEAYRKKISGFSYDDLRDTTIRVFAHLSNHLYDCLVKPAEPYIKNKKIIIIPDDALTQVPFEVLVTAPLSVKKPASFATMPYLVRKHAISYSYSGTLYAMNHQTSIYHKAKLLAVAPGYEKIRLGQFTEIDTAFTQLDPTELLPIPGTFDEVKKINQVFGGRTLMKRQATEEHFKELAGKYDILHLATHGIINNDYPMFSKLVFTPRKDSINEGLLNTYEIYNMKINAPLVVLSACNTGYGKLHKGEGVISLTRGFFTAGAKSIIMTMWAVDDKTSAKLMQYFYTNLAAKQDIRDALYHAKLEYLEQSDELQAHPYFWAGYIALGNTSATFEPYHPKTKYYIWTGIGLLIMAGIAFREKKRRSLKLRR